MTITYQNGLNGDEQADWLPSRLHNHQAIFFAGNGIRGDFCTGGSGPRIEIFNSKGQHICGCSLEPQSKWLGTDEDGTIRYGVQYGHFGLHKLSLKNLLAYMAPKWREEAVAKMQQALIGFEATKVLEDSLNE